MFRLRTGASILSHATACLKPDGRGLTVVGDDAQAIYGFRAASVRNILAKYPRLRETPSGDPRQRTSWNVRDCDAVLALFDWRGMAISPGTRLAVACATECGRPCLCLDLDAPESLGAPESRAKTFIASPVDEASRVLGYYTLAPASLAYARAPSVVTRGARPLRGPRVSGLGACR